jgi:hypothetical protein
MIKVENYIALNIAKSKPFVHLRTRFSGNQAKEESIGDYFVLISELS